MVAQAEAELAVAQANLAEAQSALEITTRELQRIEALRARGVSSESQFDIVQAEHLTKEAQLKVARAQVTRAEAALASARIRLGYTQVTADWAGGNEQRVVAERFIDEGDTVAANAPLLSIVELNPIIGVIFVAERDYARLQRGQPALLTTDAYAGEHFQGRIERIAPIFRQATRQARVELVIENPQHRLKPGMFIRATVVLDRALEATIVPEQALTTRDDRVGVFVVNEDGHSVAWREVQVGIREGDRVQVQGEGLTGRVVTLGQQLVHDGAAIAIADGPSDTGATLAEKDGT
jgi:RND family efflux transporter MFP subunit